MLRVLFVFLLFGVYFAGVLNQSPQTNPSTVRPTAYLQRISVQMKQAIVGDRIHELNARYLELTDRYIERMQDLTTATSHSEWDRIRRAMDAVVFEQRHIQKERARLEERYRTLKDQADAF